MFIVNFFLHILIAIIIGWVYYFHRNRRLLGGFIGGVVVALLGGVIGNLFANQFKVFIDFLMNGMYISHINFIATLFGTFIFLSIYGKISIDKK